VLLQRPPGPEQPFATVPVFRVANAQQLPLLSRMAELLYTATKQMRVARDPSVHSCDAAVQT
jgi:hypothetical protein